MEPIFNKLFKLQVKASNRPLEDYLTEIFAYCLETDQVFRNNFLLCLELENRDTSSLSIDTQCIYQAEGRRTDLEINLGHSFVLVESKVASTEGVNQLDDYAKLLVRKGADHKLLVFLTAKREEKFKLYPLGINFQQLRWHDVGRCINAHCHPFTHELKKFLKVNQLYMENINYQDIVAFQAFFATRKKLNDILRNDVSQIYRKKGLYQYRNNQPSFHGDIYGLLYKYGEEVNVSVGFNNWGDHPSLITRLWISNKKDPGNEIAKAISEKLKDKGWNLITTHKDGYSIQRKERLVKFLEAEDNQRTDIVQFFKDCIESLVPIKTDYPKIFNITTKRIASLEEGA